MKLITPSPFDHMKINFEALRPISRSVSLSSRPQSSKERCGRSSQRSSRRSSAVTSRPRSVYITSKSQLSSLEVESILQQKVVENFNVLKKSFEIYDPNRSNSVTKGEFRRVLDNYCLPLTTEQFKKVLNKVGVNLNETVPWIDFLAAYSGKKSSPHSSISKKLNSNGWILTDEKSESNISLTSPRSTRSAKHQSSDTIEHFLKEKICQNFEQIIKSFRFFDYNADGQIQRFEFRRILEKFCFKLNDFQFAKLCSRYDLSHNGCVDYQDFIRRLGVVIAPPDDSSEIFKKTKIFVENAAIETGRRSDGTSRASMRRERGGSKLKTPLKPFSNTPSSPKITFEKIEKEFRQKLRERYPEIRQAMIVFDRNRDGFIEIEDLKALLDNFLLPTSLPVFQALMTRAGIRGTGKISWSQFLDKFQDPQSNGNGQTLPIGCNHKVNPIRQSNECLSPRDLFKRLRSHFQSHFSCPREAFLKIDKVFRFDH